ncbi:MAG: class I SAM-dependent methyltransferase [Mariprofundus sp.]|nr:class I SAM-dependent methyltransferase [Mariprofundus sp.]
MQADLCKAFVSEVLKFRKALNLTSISDADIFNTRFIMPSLALSSWVPDQGRLLDVGSGMGVPGIPLLIAKQGLTGVLVERRKKRAEFLRHIIRTLGLTAEVYDADINALPSLHVDICVARAVADEARLLDMCGRHVAPGAIAVLPVPRSHRSVQADGWTMLGEHSVCLDDSEENIQCVRCYQHR